MCQNSAREHAFSFKDINIIPFKYLLDAPEKRGRRGVEGPEGSQPGEDGQRPGAASVGPGGELPPG